MHKALSLIPSYPNWNPELGYEPEDSLSATLLQSIPRKVNAWLERLQFPVLGAGNYECLHWDFREDAGSVLIDDESEDFIQIWWTGPLNNIQHVYGSDDRFLDLSNNLQFLVGIENRFYDILQKLENDVSDHPVINYQKVYEKLVADRDAAAKT